MRGFLVFLSFFTTIIGVGYFYIGLKMIPNLGLHGIGVVVAWIIIALLVFSIPISYFISHTVASPKLQTFFSFSSFLSLGFFTILLTLVVIGDLLSGLISAILYLFPNLSTLIDKAIFDSLVPSHWSILNLFYFIFLVLAGVLTLWGIFQAHSRLRIVEVFVPIKNLHPDLEGFTIAQISDVHIGPTIQRPFLHRVVKRIQSMNPDFVAITGDLVDGPSHLYREHILPLKDLSSKYGTFFVTGNHEYYNGVLSWLKEIESLGIQTLLNENRIFTKGKASFAIAGVTDLQAGRILASHATNAKKSMLGIENSDFKILLAHQPNSVYEAAKAGFDLQLSGHTHGGQYFPGNLIIYLAQKFVAGLHLYDKTLLYVSRGTGYWGPPIRIGAPSEITKLILVKDNGFQKTKIKVKRVK